MVEKNHPASELAEIIRLRTALERLVEELRWRVDSGGFRDRERQVFDEAVKALEGE